MDTMWGLQPLSSHTLGAELGLALGRTGRPVCLGTFLDQHGAVITGISWRYGDIIGYVTVVNG